MNYSDLVTALGDLMVVTITDSTSATPSNDTNFNNILPSIFNDAQNRIYREVDPLHARDTIYAANAIANQRIVDLPASTIVLQGANIITNPSIKSQSPGNNAGDLYFIASTGQQFITIQDEYDTMGTIAVGEWVNIVTLFSTAGNFTVPFLQGPYQIASITSNIPGQVLQYTITMPTASSGNFVINSTGMQFTTVSGSKNVSVNLTAHGLSVGSIITIGSDTVMGSNTTIEAGDYTVISITTADIFTFDLPAVAQDSAGPTYENQGPLIIQYLSNPPYGTKNRVEMVSKDALDIIWPIDLSEQAVPKYGALIDNATMAVGPVPDQNYIMEFTGIFRPASISATNTSTYLSETYPDVLLAACMVFGMLYQKDADQPQGAAPGMDMQKWETIYQSRSKSMKEEIARQKGESTNWSPYSQTPLSNPARP